jgi:hypothetical protein
MDDREASEYYDRFASREDRYREFDNDALYDGATQHLGQLPDDQLYNSAQGAFEQAAPHQRTSLVQTLLAALQGHGTDVGRLGPQLGLRSLDPNRMSGSDFAQLVNFTRRSNPGALRQTVQQQPWLVKALGNPIVMGALGVVAARMMRKHAVGR